MNCILIKTGLMILLALLLTGCKQEKEKNPTFDNDLSSLVQVVCGRSEVHLISIPNDVQDKEAYVKGFCNAIKAQTI